MKATKSTMKTAPTFEIKIAVIGPVSAGKSTLINALLIGKYCEVSIKRTTAGINFFRLHPIPKDPSSVSSNNSGGHDKNKVSSSSASTAWSLVPDKIDAEDDILNQISTDNKTFRELNQVQERPFDIEGVELCETRSDTKMVIVDVPGLNEAESSSKYRDYIQDKWQTFDCVILVMDARHGVNTEEQVDLLEFTKRNMKEKKDLPVIILFNKVDELNDDKANENGDVVYEARAKIESMFDIGPSHKDMVKDIVNMGAVPKRGNHFNRDVNGKFVPIFLPISARNGYVYRLAQAVDMERFKKLEKDLVEKLGKDQIGIRKWNKLSDTNKFKESYNTIRDPEVYEEGLKTSNFESFMKILSHCVAGNQTQSNLIKGQIEVEMKYLIGAKGLAERVSGLIEKMVALDLMEICPLFDAFRTAFDVLETHTLLDDNDFPLSYKIQKNITVPLDELITYHNTTSKFGFTDESKFAIERAKKYLNLYVNTVLPVVTEFSKNPIGLYHLVQMLVMDGNRHFEKHFSNLKTILDISYGRMLFMSTRKWYCYVCKKTVQECHFWYDGTCRTTIDETKCPYNGCVGALEFQIHTGAWHCKKCGRTYLRPSQLLGSITSNCFELRDGKWSIIPETTDAMSGGSTNVSSAFSSHHLKTSCGVIPDEMNVPPSCPRHYGHLFWMFCEWMDCLENEHISKNRAYSIGLWYKIDKWFITFLEWMKSLKTKKYNPTRQQKCSADNSCTYWQREATPLNRCQKEKFV